MLKQKWIYVLLCLGLVSCSEEKPQGTIHANVIQPTGRHCEYTIAPGPITTLHSLTDMKGALGAVVTSSENLGSREEILDKHDGLNSVDVQFARSGNTYTPLDMDSLFALSLYYAVEFGYQLFTGLDSSESMTKVDPLSWSRTLIVHEARRTFGEIGVDPEVTDNAEYLSHRVTDDSGNEMVLNYLFSFPTDEVEDIPLGLNLGIMVHEYSHLVMQHLFWEKGISKDTLVSSEKPTKQTLGALDEGLADYFGYLATKDPGYFLCSFPSENRDLSVKKEFTDELIASLGSDRGYDTHTGGAVFAAINYEIGQAIGRDQNGIYLVQLMSSLLTCSNANLSSDSNTLNMDFGSVAACHAAIAKPEHKSQISSIYRSRLGSYGGI